MTDRNPVVAECKGDEAPVVMVTKSEERKACHVQQSKYFLQFFKFSDESVT